MPVLPQLCRNESLIPEIFPHQAVAVHVEGDGVYEVVDGPHHVLPVLARRAVLDGQAAGYEVILDINHHQGSAGPGHFLDPLRPAEHELLLAQLPAPADIEDLEQFLQLRRLQSGVGNIYKYLVFCMMSLKLFTTPLLSVALAISYSIFGGIDNYSNIPGGFIFLQEKRK